jgi:4-hydroxyphenylacetate 3-monooxygenase
MALRTGAEYLQALRDGREVYLDGRRVKDVTTEPGLSIVAHTFAHSSRSRRRQWARF